MGTLGIDKRLSVLFFLSGATGLVYEVIWAKHLALLFGNTAHAHAVVLATFLGGLAIGNALLGRRADGTAKPLRLYALLEVCIGVLGALSPTLLALAGDLYVTLARGGLQGTWGAVALRLCLSAAVLLPPAMLMGGTLPTLTRFATRSLAAAERTVSWLYFLNTAGAVLGTLGAGMVLIPSLGLNGGVWVAAVTNVAIGAVAFWLERAGAVRAAPRTEDMREPQPEPQGGRIYAARHVRIAYVVIFLSGMVALAFEIAWIRVLTLILGSTTYSFTLMVAAFIGGIAVGSALITRRIFPRLDTFLLLGLAEIGIALAVLATMPIYERLPHYFTVARGMLAPTTAAFAFYELLKLAVCLVVLLLPTTFIGMTVPLASRVAIGSVGTVGATVGRVFSVNTVGNVLGATLAGIFLMPAIGAQGLVWGGLVLVAGCGAVVVALAEWPRKNKLQVAGAFAAVLVLSTLISPGGWDRELLVSGSFRWSAPEPSFAAYAERVHQSELVFYRDDADATVSVHRAPVATGLRVNGKPDASSHIMDMGTQLLLAHTPMLLHEDPASVLIIGLGSGTTAGAALRYPLRHLDVVEISQGVVDASAFFTDVNYRPLADPRLELHVEDAKGFLRLTEQTYDVIISEPSNPWVAGIGSLFTREFYAEARQHLAPAGFMAQWLHTYAIDEDSVAMILRTFSDAFAEVSVWELGDRNDLLLIGSAGPIDLDPQALAARFQRSDVRSSLELIGIHEPLTLLANQLGGTEMVRRIGGKGRLNEDLTPVLEYEAPRAFFLREPADRVSNADERLAAGGGDGLLFNRYLGLRGSPASAGELRDMADYFRSKRRPTLASAVLTEWLRRFPDDRDALVRQARMLAESEAHDAAATLYERLLEAAPEDPELLESAAKNALALYRQRRSAFGVNDLGAVIARYERWEQVAGDGDVAVAEAIAAILSAEKRPSDALVHIDRAIAKREERGDGKPALAALYARAIDIAEAAGAGDRALEYARVAVQKHPDSRPARRRLSALEARAGL